MELFYGGKRKEAPQQKAEDDLSSDAEASPGSTSEKTPSQTVRKETAQATQVGAVGKGSPEEPANLEPYYKEGYPKEPSLKEPFLEIHSKGQVAEEPRVEIEEDKEPNKISGKLSGEIGSPTTGFLAESVHNKGAHKKPYYEEPFLQEPSIRTPLSEVPFASEPYNIFITRPVSDTFRTAFEILPTLAPLEQLLYLWFLNLTHAIGRESCRATMALLQRATGVSEKLVRETLRSLLGRGHLRLLDGGAAGRAALYRVAHPREVLEQGIEGSIQEPFSQEPSLGEPFLKEASPGKLPD
ncbi:MAG TPA: hypothetical protein VGX03_27390, partial [Candidatus Binatia bacterium]|nr:hypothetical protein [Candidatus Binatia bacterium]